MIPRLLWIICFASASPALAQEWTVTEVPGLKYPLKCKKGDATKCAILLLKGEPAPITGVLQTPRQAASVGVAADPEFTEARTKIEVDTATQTVAANKDLEIRLLKIDKERLEADLALTTKNYEQRVKLLEDALPSNWEKPLSVAVLTTVAVLGVIGGSVAIACKLTGCSK